MRDPDTGRRAVLFDIDGTLLDAQGTGRPAFAAAFAEAYGVIYPHMETVSFVGATDSGVVRMMAATCGVSSTATREAAFFRVLAERLDRALAERPPRVYGGVVPFIRALAEDGRFVLGLVTGNVRATAWIKLRHGGIARYFRFGAYGDDHHDRDEITRLALARRPPGVTGGMLIGDTPLDIRAAKANGLVAAAVATGWVDAETLRAAGADRVFESFDDWHGCLDAVGDLCGCTACCNVVK